MTKNQKIVFFGFFLILVGVSLYQSSSRSKIKAHIQETAEVKPEISEPVNGTIEMRAEMWEFTPSVIRLKKGEPVTIKLVNIDFNHGIVIPKLGLKAIEKLTFTPDQNGEFEFYCPTYCGAGHGNMRGKIIVE